MPFRPVLLLKFLVEGFIFVYYNLVPCLPPFDVLSSRNKRRRIIFSSKVTVTVGKDPANDPEFLLEKLGNVDFSSIGGDAAGGKGLQALAELRYSLSKVYMHGL